MKQYNRVCARINLDAIAYNMEQMKNRIGQEGRLIAVIKTDAYGHGAVPIAKELNIPREEVVFALDAIQDPVSLFEPIYHDGGDAIYVMDQISDSKNSDDSWLENISIKEAMKKLNDREKNIMEMRFGFKTGKEKTQKEVADELRNITKLHIKIRKENNQQNEKRNNE